MILTRYISKNLGFYIGISTAFFVLVLSFQQSFRFLSLVTMNRIALYDLLLLVFFWLPEFVALVLPITFFLGSVLAYKQMYQDQVVFVLYANGLDNSVLFRPFLYITSSLFIFLLFFTLYLSPVFLRSFRKTELKLRASISKNFLKTGEFQPFGNRVVSIKEKSKKGMRGVFIFEKTPGKTVSLASEEGYARILDNKIYLRLKRGVQHTVTKKGVDILTFDTYDLTLFHQKSGAYPKKIYEMTLSELFHEVKNQHDGWRYAFEGMNRIFSPIFLCALGALVFLLFGKLVVLKSLYFWILSIALLFFSYMLYFIALRLASTSFLGKGVLVLYVIFPICIAVHRVFKKCNV